MLGEDKRVPKRHPELTERSRVPGPLPQRSRGIGTGGTLKRQRSGPVPSPLGSSGRGGGGEGGGEAGMQRAQARDVGPFSND